jgi:hypothetical protein
MIAMAAVVGIVPPAGTQKVARAADFASAFIAAGAQTTHSQSRYLLAETYEEWCESHRAECERLEWGEERAADLLG